LANSIRIALRNASTNAASASVFELSANNTNSQLELMAWAGSATDAYGNRAVLRSTGSSSNGVSIIATGSGDTIKFYSSGVASTNLAAIITNNGMAIGQQTTPATWLELEELETLAASPADGYAAAITLDPGYTAAFTVTRHNYFDVQDVSVAASAVVTDACLFRFDAAIGTHKAVGAATTKTSPGTVTAWIKINIAGTVHYMPAYSSTTS